MTQADKAVPSPNTYLMVPGLILFVLLSFAVIRGPALISSSGIGSAVIVVAPLILSTYALTAIVMAGRAGVDLSIGPLIGFINVGMIQLLAAGYIESPIAFFLYAMAVGIAYQLGMGLIIVYVRVQPIIVSLSGYLALVGLNLLILPRPGGVAPDWMMDWGSGTSIWSPVLVILIIATLAWYALARTAFFGHLRLMGSDERAAFTSGVRITVVRLGAHCIAGIYAGLASICFTSLISSGDPTQGTTFTLMAVTALVLGGANLAGGRGGATGALLGALNIYLITYILATFNFGKVQSFVTDLSYGSILVLSLLISSALPQIQRFTRYLKPGLFFVLLGTVTGGIVIHATMDSLTQITTAVTELGDVLPVATGADDGAGGNNGQVIFLIILGRAALIYVANLLVKHFKAPMVLFVAVIIITAVGVVFYDRPVVSDAPSTDQRTVQTFDYGIDHLALDDITAQNTLDAGSNLLTSASYSLLLVAGVILLTTIILLFNFAEVTLTTDKVRPFLLFTIGIALIVMTLIFANHGDKSGSSFGAQGIFIGLAGLILFIAISTPFQSRVSNISNYYIFVISLLAFGCIYFLASPDTGFARYAESPEIFDAPFISAAPVVANTGLQYEVPGRLAETVVGLITVSQWAYSALIVLALELAIWGAMRGQFRDWKFLRFGHIIVGSSVAWGWMFYSVGVSLWNVAGILLATIITAPFIWRLIENYRRPPSDLASSESKIIPQRKVLPLGAKR